MSGALLRVMAPPSPRARFAFSSHPSLEKNSSLVKLLAFDFRQLVAMDPLLLARLPIQEYIKALLSFLGFSPASIVSKGVSHTAHLTAMSVETWFPASPAGVQVRRLMGVDSARDRGAA